MHPYTKSLEILTEQLNAHREKLNRIIIVHAALKTAVDTGEQGDHIKFEVHVGANIFSVNTVRLRGTSLREIHEKALLLYKKKKKKNDPGVGKPQAFICIDEKWLIALDPVDAVEIGNQEPGPKFETHHFSIDSRMVEFGKLVWEINEELPGCHPKDLTVKQEETSTSTCSHD